MLDFLVRQWFLAALAVSVGLGLGLSPALATLPNPYLKNAIVFVVMFLMALPIPLSHFGDTLRKPYGAALAVGVNFGLLPLVAWLLAQILAGDWRTGLIITAAAPCTLASAAVWTRRAGGNDTTALLVTVVTNGTCFFITPLWLLLAGPTAGSAAGPTINLLGMVLKLGGLVVLPMALGQVARWSPLVAEWATIQKKALSVAAMVGVLSIVFLGSITAGLELRRSSVDALPPWLNLVNTSLMVVCTLGLHAAMLSTGFFASQWLRLPREEAIAVGISGSQKTLMVGLYIATTFFPGLALIPMLLYHVGQLLIDTAVADWWSDASSEPTVS